MRFGVASTCFLCGFQHWRSASRSTKMKLCVRFRKCAETQKHNRTRKTATAIANWIWFSSWVECLLARSQPLHHRESRDGKSMDPTDDGWMSRVNFVSLSLFYRRIFHVFFVCFFFHGFCSRLSNGAFTWQTENVYFRLHPQCKSIESTKSIELFRFCVGKIWSRSVSNITHTHSFTHTLTLRHTWNWSNNANGNNLYRSFGAKK